MIRFKPLGLLKKRRAAAVFGLLALSLPNRVLADQVVHATFVSERMPTPFEIGDGHIFFTAKIAGAPVSAMLDNGSQNNVVDKGYAERIGLHISDRGADMATPTGTVARFEISSLPVLIPGQIAFDAPVTVLDLSAFSKVLGRRLDFVFGHEFLAATELIVATGDKSFYLFPSATQSPPPQYPSILLENDRPQVKVQINGQAALLTIDLGSAAALTISPSAAKRLALRNMTTGNVMVGNVEGKLVEAPTGSASQLVIGGTKASNVKFTIAPILPADGDGVLGFGFFRNYDFVMDISARKLWLAPLSDFHLK